MMTETEARSKWCPLARVTNWSSQMTGGGINATNRQENGSVMAQSKCIASSCMAWRKIADSEFDEFGNLPGYCGAFGAPT